MVESMYMMVLCQVKKGFLIINPRFYTNSTLMKAHKFREKRFNGLLKFFQGRGFGQILLQ